MLQGGVSEGSSVDGAEQVLGGARNLSCVIFASKYTKGPVAANNDGRTRSSIDVGHLGSSSKRLFYSRKSRSQNWGSRLLGWLWKGGVFLLKNATTIN